MRFPVVFSEWKDYLLIELKTNQIMEKYLHKYTSAKDFNDDYIGVGEITAITIHSAELFQTCNDWDNMVETHDYDGTYVFDREEEITNATDCKGNSQGDFRMKVFKNGNKEIYSVYSNYYGKWGHENGWIDIFQDFSSVYQSGDGTSHNFTPEYAEGPYHEPWVSLTKVNRIVYEHKWHDHVGEVDVYDDETEDYIGKMHLWRSEDGSQSAISESETPGTNDTIYFFYDGAANHQIYTGATATASDIQRGSRVDYNRRIWMDLSNYEYPTNLSSTNLGTVPEPKPSNRGKVYVKEPDGQTYPYNYRKQGNGVVLLGLYNPDLSGYEIIILPNGTAEWRYIRGLQ